MGKNTLIYPSHFELINELTDEQAGKLIKSIGKYELGIATEFDDMLVKGIFISIKRDFDLQKQNYDKKCKTNRENGKGGGRPKKLTITEDNPQNPIGYFKTQPNPQNLKDKDKDKDKDIDKEKALQVYNAPDIIEIENTNVDYMIDETDIELTRPMIERVIDKFISIDSRFKLQSVLSEIDEDYGGFDNVLELYLPNDTSAQMNYKKKLQQYKNGIYA